GSALVKLLFFGDVVGKPGRQALKLRAQALAESEKADLLVANCENSSGGIGVDPGSAREMFSFGIHVLTSGNHIWHRKEIYDFIDSSDRLLRPANFAPGVPGRGWSLYETARGPVAVVNLIGRVFMAPADCPFRAADQILETIADRTRVILVDMHAEATSEKVGMGRYLDGRVSAVVGSHTHVQTADEQILPGGTAYLTDLGMTGPHNGVIGIQSEIIIERFLRGTSPRMEHCDGEIKLNGSIVD